MDNKIDSSHSVILFSNDCRNIVANGHAIIAGLQRLA